MMTPLERVRAALGRRLQELLEEDPRRRAWLDLDAAALDRAFRDAQGTAHGGRAGRPFATLLIERLDHAIHIAPDPEGSDEMLPGDTRDDAGRIHRPDHEHPQREGARRAREAAAEEAYAGAYAAALDEGLGDPEAHRRASAAREDVLQAKDR